MVAVDVAVGRRVERPSWINLRTTLGLLLFAIALVGGQRILSAAKVTVEVWAAARDLSQDTVLQTGDLRPVAVKMPPDVLAGYAPADASLDGAIVSRAVRAGELVPLAWVSAVTGPEAARSITIPVDPEHALGAALRPGDRVDVFATFDASDARARTSLVARAVEVEDVVTTPGISFEDESIAGITVSVTRDEAARLAFAARAAAVDVVRVDGRAGGGGPTTVTRANIP